MYDLRVVEVDFSVTMSADGGSSNASDNEETLNTIDTITVFKYKETVVTYDQAGSEFTDAALALVDDDDDLILPRKRQTESILKIEHSTYTDVEFVGLQVWSGAILLAEFIIFESHKFKNKRVLEIGSGTGLVSIVAAKCSADVVCTDLDDDTILKTIERNVQNNREMVQANFKILPFNFSKEWTTDVETAIDLTDIILASELIYDNDISRNLVEALVKILKRRPNIIVYFSVEKRYVFTLANQKVEATHYEYFFSLLKQYLRDALPKHELSQIIDIPQYFYEYERCNETELWCISINK